METKHENNPKQSNCNLDFSRFRDTDTNYSQDVPTNQGMEYGINGVTLDQATRGFIHVVFNWKIRVCEIFVSN